MEAYHKIQTIFKRDEKKKLIEGEWTLPEFEYLANLQWRMEEKIDGTNIRVIWTGKRIKFKGRKESSSIPAHLVNALMDIFEKKKFIEVFQETPVTFYGEGFGKGIQGKFGIAYADYILKDSEETAGFVLFDVKIGRWWIQRHDLEDLAETFSIPLVPVYDYGTLFQAVDLCKQGFNSLFANGEIESEGFVLKPTYELFNRKGDRIIAKLKIKDFK
jgi:hypothetical protein